MVQKSWIVFLAAFLISFAFQSCSQNDSDKNSENVGNSAPGLPEAPDRGANLPAPGAEIDNETNEALSRTGYWVLMRRIDGGRDLALPEGESFYLQLRALEPDDRACAGSCPQKYAVSGRSFCGPLAGNFSRGFDEARAEIANHFESLEAHPRAGCRRGPEDEGVLSIMREPLIEVLFEVEQELLYVRSGPRILVFEAQAQRPATIQAESESLASL